MKLIQTVFTFGLATFLSFSQGVNAQGIDPFLGQIIYFAGNFCPTGWATASGQLMAISQNTALFSLLGTFYGGDGVNTFALPNLQGRVPIAVGQGVGLSPYQVGQEGGVEAVTLTTQQIPAHNHILSVSDSAAYRSKPIAGSVLGAQCNAKGYLDSTSPNIALSSSSISQTGGSQPHSNIQPYLAMTACIALQGVYPSRD